MATYDDPYNPIPRRLREPTPGYSQTRLPGTERTVVETPRGGFSPDPAPGLSERDLTPENYAMPFSPTRSMRYGPGDERDLSVPVIDPRDPLAPAPATWSGVVPRGSGRAAYSTSGGYAFTNAPAVPDETTPRVPFADAAGESLAATSARGARMQAEQDRLGLTTADMDYIRTYGRAAYDARQAKYGQPTTREDYLRQQQGNLAASVAARRAAENELSRIERDNEAQRRREMWAAEQAARLEGAAGSADNSWRTEVARIEQETQLRAKELENQGLDRRQAQEIAARERIQKSQNEGNLAVAQAQAQGRTDAATATAQGRVDAATATAEGRVKAAGIRADATKYASDNTYRAAADASAARVEAAKAAGLSDQQVAQIRAESQERIAKLSQDGALARAGIQADAQKYVSDNAYAARADAAAAAVEAAMATADARVSAERVRAEGARLLAAENPWVALGGGVMGNRQTGDQAGRPNATASAAKPQIFKMKGADGTERLVRPREDGSGVEVLFEDPDAALVIAEQEVRNLESDKLRYGRTTAQREGYDERIAEAKARLAALREARRSAPDYEGPTGQAPTNDAADGWAAFGGIVR